MRENQSREDILTTINYVLGETGYDLRKHPFIDAWNVYNVNDHQYLTKDGEALCVTDARGLLNAIGGQIGYFADRELLDPLRDHGWYENTVLALCEGGEYAAAYAHIYNEWRNSDDEEMYYFYEEHATALALFDLIVNQEGSLYDCSLLDDLYEMQIPHIIEYKFDAEAPTEVGELAAIIREQGFIVVPNGDGFSLQDEKYGIHPTVFYSTDAVMRWLSIDHQLVDEIKKGLGTAVNLDAESAIARVEALYEDDRPLFDKLVGTAARLDTFNRFRERTELRQLAVFDKESTTMEMTNEELQKARKEANYGNKPPPKKSTIERD